MKFLFFLMMCLIGIGPALAQNANRGGGLRFHVVTPGREAPEGVNYAPLGSGAAKPLAFHPSNLSAKYPYAGPQPIVFFRETPAPDGGDPIRELVASFSPSEGINEYILIFLRGDNPGNWKIHGIPLTASSMAPTAIGFYNGLATPVRVSIGGRETVLKPGLNAPQSVEGMTHNSVTIKKREHDAATGKMVETSYEGFNEGVEVVLSRPEDKQKRPFYDTNISISPAMAYMILIFPPEDPKTRRYQLKTLSLAPTINPAPAQNQPINPAPAQQSQQ